MSPKSLGEIWLLFEIQNAGLKWALPGFIKAVLVRQKVGRNEIE